MDLTVLQYRWLMIALPGGVGLVLLLTLGYLAIWQPRKLPGAAPAKPTPGEWFRSFMPWILIVTYVGLAAWAVIFTIWMAGSPPNW
jgi:hypothetical protein